MRSKVLMHVCFWMTYWSINTYLDFFWAMDKGNIWPMSELILRVMAASLLYILPLITLAYYLVFIGLEKITAQKDRVSAYILHIGIPYVLAICASIVLVRLISVPYIYQNAFKMSILFFDPRRIFSIFIEAAFPIGLLLASRYVNMQLNAKEREKNLIREKMTAEMKALKNQFNPHFLFNTLNSIYALSRKKSDETPEVVMKLSEMLSFILYEANQPKIPIRSEVKFLSDYIDLQKMRFSKLELTFKQSVDDDSNTVAPLLLLPLVENAFKHGPSESRLPSYIQICLKTSQNQLWFMIRNNYEKKSVKDKIQTIGLDNLRRQLELSYAEQKLIVEDKDQNFEVHLWINLKSDENV